MSKGRPPVRRPPSEKKALSYAKDRRNSYGENDKAARKAIPRRKAIENRGARRKVAAALHTLDSADERRADLIESDARNDIQRVGGWTKGADEPLGRVLANKPDRSNSRKNRRLHPNAVRGPDGNPIL